MKISVSRGTSTMAAVACLVLAALVLASSAERSEAAPVKHCAAVVRGFDFSVGSPDFYKSKVLIVKGASEVGCSEARKVAWRLMDPPDFCDASLGGCDIRGWHCLANGFPASGKCIREEPRRVIRLTRPKPCPKCRANRN
jgi:hypothetical protein